MMRWRLVIGVLLLAIIYVVAENLEADGCIASFPAGGTAPNVELMNAMYVADPDVDTGRIIFITTGEDTANGVLSGSKLSYTNWLAKRRDARKDMVNLWFYVASLVTTNLVDLTHHYKIAARLGTNKPRGVIDFNKLYDLFNTACTKYSTVHFWMTCFDKKFYCSFKEVFTHQQVVIKTGSTLKSIEDVASMSMYGIDDNNRAIVLSDLFHLNIIKYIPQQTRKDLFYQSDLVFDSIDTMLYSKNDFIFWVKAWGGRSIKPVRTKMVALCSSDASSAVSQEYYCVGKRFMDKMEACSKLNTIDVCLFDPLLQEYFSGGSFDNIEKLRFLPKFMSRSKAILGEFNTKITGKDYPGLQALNNKYAPYITMDNSACSLNWMRRFDCEKNFGCVYDLGAELKFDCNGGSTCKLNTIYRFDCMISFILKPSQRLVASTSNVIRNEEANVWLAYPPMVQYYAPHTPTRIGSLVKAVQKRAKPMVMAYDTAKLKIYLHDLPKQEFVPFFMHKMACVRETVELRYMTFCNLNALFEAISMYLDAFSRSSSNMVVLNPTTNYVTLIEQLQLERVQSFLHAQMSFYFDDITAQLQQNFGALSNYFSSLANFDKKKAEADIGFIHGKLNDFKTQIAPLMKAIRDRFIGLFTGAFVAAAADIAQKAVIFGTYVAEACNPLKAMFGGGSVPDVATSFSDMMQSIANLVGIARLLGDVIPTLSLGHEISSAFDKNTAQLLDVKKLIDGLKTGTKDMTTESNKFLGMYNSYTPQIEKSKISDYTEKLSQFSADLCDKAFAGTTAAAAIVEMGISTSGVCNLLGPTILKLGTIYEEIYDYQFDMMDSLAEAVRAYLASSKATAMTSVYKSKQRVNVAFMSRMALNSFIVSTLHVWTIVLEYCNHLAYLKGGVVPSHCARAVQVPSQFNVANVLGLGLPTCSINNEISDYVNIPTKPMPTTDRTKRSRDKSYIDLEKLYEGKVVEFEVPSLQWLRDNKWVAGTSERAMYIRRFSLFLTPMSGSSTQTVELSVEHGGNVKLAENGKIRYILPIQGLASRYTSRYKENAMNCFGTALSNPYDVCKRDVPKLCILSDGIDRKAVPPTIYNRWKVKATILPTGATAPKATTKFVLKAALTYCEVDLSAAARKTRDVNHLEDIGLPRTTRAAIPWCCTAPAYWNVASSSCAACPTGSTPRLNGYYCQ